MPTSLVAGEAPGPVRFLLLSDPDGIPRVLAAALRVAGADGGAGVADAGGAVGFAVDPGTGFVPPARPETIRTTTETPITTLRLIMPMRILLFDQGNRDCTPMDSDLQSFVMRKE